MASRISSPVVRRASLPLTEQDELDIALLRSSPALRRALADAVTGGDARALQSDSASEAALLHAVFAVGLARLREEADEVGYAELAASYLPAEHAENRRSARRRRPAWASET